MSARQDVAVWFEILAIPKTQLPDGMGYFAQFIDSEGHRVGLHSMS